LQYVTDGKPLPSLPGHDAYAAQYMMEGHISESGDGRSNVPLIRLGLGDVEDDDFFYDTSDEDRRNLGGLSPISERTELTEYSRDWPLPADPPLIEDHSAASSSVSTSDYGNVIGERSR
jgi:hypothetical protein